MDDQFLALWEILRGKLIGFDFATQLLMQVYYG